MFEFNIKASVPSDTVQAVINLPLAVRQALWLLVGEAAGRALVGHGWRWTRNGLRAGLSVSVTQAVPLGVAADPLERGDGVGGARNAGGHHPWCFLLRYSGALPVCRDLRNGLSHSLFFSGQCLIGFVKYWFLFILIKKLLFSASSVQSPL